MPKKNKTLPWIPLTEGVYPPFETKLIILLPNKEWVPVFLKSIVTLPTRTEVIFEHESESAEYSDATHYLIITPPTD